MIMYFLFAAVTMALACGYRQTAYMRSDGFISRQQTINRIIVIALFTLLTGLAALRIEVGNDYGTYVVTCHEIFQRGYVVTEPGYNLIVRILYTLSGKEDYLLMFGVFAAAIAAIILKIIKDQSDSFALSFYIFMTMGLYFKSFNTVRYYFALLIAIYSLRYVIDITHKNDNRINYENLIKFLLLITLAATFHKSVLVVIPMYLFARLKWNRWVYAVMCVAAALLYVFRAQVMDLALKLYPSYKDTVYVEQTHSISENYAAIAGCILILILCIIYYKAAIADRADNRLYHHLNVMAILMYLSCSFLPLITRFGYYLITPEILLVPNIICSIKDEDEKRRVKLAAVVFCALYFVYFLHIADRVGIRVLPYKSWLFYDHYWLNQTDTF